MTAPFPRAWPDDSLARIPYWLYQDPDVYARELRGIFEGPAWSFACLEADIANPGDYRTTSVGEMPIIVVRGRDGAINAFENRCSHRGALIVFDDGGNTAKPFQCVYHSWSYDLEGNLIGVAFQKGANGRGGMPACFSKADNGLRKLRTTTICGLVFVTLSDAVAPIEEYIGDGVRTRLARVLNRPVEVLGRFTQTLPHNWKIYVENVRDTYHASLLHTFFSTFGITRLTQAGGVIVSPDGGHHATYTVERPEDAASAAHRVDGDSLQLIDPSLLNRTDEFGDGIKLQILSVFPCFVLQQIQNCIAVRQVIPKGTGSTDLVWTFLGYTDDTPEMRLRRLRQINLVGPAGYVSMEDGCVGGFVQRGIVRATEEVSLVHMGGEGIESQETRATEVAVRGFWSAYRRMTGL